MDTTKIKSILTTYSGSTTEICQHPVTVSGWVKTKRSAKNVVFISLNDGSTIKNLQVVLNPQIVSPETLADTTTGTSITVEGKIIKSLRQEQPVELLATQFKILGKSDTSYPLQPKNHTLEFLRTISHLRFRTSTISAVMRIRSTVSYAIHNFFRNKDFVYIHSPIITTTDGEGAGEMFSVTTLNYDKILQSNSKSVDYKQDFFQTKASLTVTGQLEAETAIYGLSSVYTFGPTFRAENSNTTRHLAEFWMVEPEIAFCDLEGNIALATEMLKYVISYVIDSCDDDLEFLEKKSTSTKTTPDKPPLRSYLRELISSPFIKITYTEAIDILIDSHHNKNKKFKNPIDKWGCDLGTDHERFLVEHYFKKPVIISDYPKEIKAFYMRQNDDNTTVAAMDILFPGIGEVIGGSQREERYDKLLQAINNTKLNPQEMQWYLDTRRFGSVVHSGFGLGLERLIMFITGIENIRDVIPFPRTPGNAYNMHNLK